MNAEYIGVNRMEIVGLAQVPGCVLTPPASIEGGAPPAPPTLLPPPPPAPGVPALPDVEPSELFPEQAPIAAPMANAPRPSANKTRFWPKVTMVVLGRGKNGSRSANAASRVAHVPRFTHVEAARGDHRSGILDRKTDHDVPTIFF